MFKDGKYDEAIDIFIELDTNPAQVVSLYPESIAGRLSTSEQDWIALFGGPKEEIPVIPERKSSEEVNTTEEHQKTEGGDQQALTSTSAAPALGPTASLKGYLPNLMRSAAKDDDTASISSRRSVRRKVTMDIFETFGVQSATNNTNTQPVTSTPTHAPTTTAPAQLSPGRFQKLGPRTSL